MNPSVYIYRVIQKILESRFKWIFILFVLIYLISPIDFVPDFPIFGYIDDGVLLVLVLHALFNTPKKNTPTKTD